MAWLDVGVRFARGRWTALSHLVVVSWIVAGPFACKQGNAPPPGADPAPGASQPPEDPKTPKKVTKADCLKWATHGADSFVASVRFATEQCAPASRDAVRKKFEDEIVSIRGGAESICTKHIDESYSPTDAACFMNAKDALTLRACKFAPMQPPDDDDWGLLLKSMHDRCTVIGAVPVPPPAGAAPSGSVAKP